MWVTGYLGPHRVKGCIPLQRQDFTRSFFLVLVLILPLPTSGQRLENLKELLPGLGSRTDKAFAKDGEVKKSNGLKLARAVAVVVFWRYSPNAIAWVSFF